jgi:hypothetical protein
MNTHDNTEILNRFPNIKLSYETFVHKKVYDYDYVLAIPEGIKHFVWFTKIKERSVCIILEISRNKQINNIEILPLDENGNALCSEIGTICYGTIFNAKNIRFFTLEDLFYFNGNRIISDSIKKFKLFKFILSNLQKSFLFENKIVFGMPLMKTKNDFDKLIKEINLLPYKIKSLKFFKQTYNAKFFKQEVQIRTLDYVKLNGNFTYENNKKRELVFKVRPLIQNDIYNLYTSDDTLVGLAYISNYNCSVMLNKLFRNIKENNNLDLLEESDDEDEFENDLLDKYVYLDRVYNMVCCFNYKFKKWEPIRLAKVSENVSCKKDLLNL